MSWQAYIDTSLVGTGHVCHGCIFSAAGDSVWASSPELTPSNAEMKFIADILDGKSAAKDKAFSEGLVFAGKKYVMTKVDGRSAYARSRKHGDEGGKDGLAICKSSQAIIVGHHNENQIAGNTSNAVEALTDYLIKAGY